MEEEKRAKILIVEDEQVVAHFIRQVLEDKGYQITGVATCMDEALASIEREQPDLVLMDIVLRNSDEGIQVASRIRDMFGIPVVYLTAFSDTATIEAARQTLPYAYLIKPVVPCELLTTVGLVLERAQLEKALRESEERYRIVLGNIHIGIVEIVYDTTLEGQSTYRYVNPAMARIFGYDSCEEFVRISPEQLYYDPRDRQSIFEELRVKDTINDRIVRGRKKDGSPVWLSLSAVLHTDQAGRRVLYGAIQDISERRQLEEEARLSEERFRQIFEQDSDGFLIVDMATGIIREANTAATLLYGCDHNKLVGSETSSFFGAQAWEELQQKLAQGQKDFVIHRQEHRRDDGTTVPVAVRGKIFAVCETMMLFLSLRDITEKLRLEQEAALRQAQLLQSDKMASIGTLAAGIAHEINNPIAFILSNLGTLQKYRERLTEFVRLLEQTVEQTASPELRQAISSQRAELKIDYVLKDLQDLISESISGAERVKKIVNDLKSFARPDTGEMTPTDLHECIEKTLSIVWNELKYTCIVEKKYGDIPLVTCNSQQMSQVFMNLLVNAAHAIQKQGTKQGTITIRTWQDGTTVCAAVSDTGCGIPPENLQRVFEPFFTTKEVGKGTGLGLSIVYDIIKKHHGDISVESEVGKGTTFTVRLPIAVRSE